MPDPPRDAAAAPDPAPASHLPVLVDAVLHTLAPRPGGLVVDCTLGLGGHAAALLAAEPELRLLGIDRDPEALEIARERLSPWRGRVEFIRGRFADLAVLLAARGIGQVDGILADLGVSSLQLDTARRGFSFRHDAPLDMRMGGEGMSAAEFLATAPVEEIESVLRRFGEERDARRIARAIDRTRAERPLNTTRELRDLLIRVKGGARREGRVDPATRVFQALRIEVNRELAELESLLDQALHLLRRDGRLVVLSYHSLEDRAVKHRLRAAARGEVDPVTGRPREETRLIEVLTRRPVRAEPAEVAANPRARSARLRAARRL